MKVLLKLTFWALGCVMISSFASCLGGDDYEGISKEDYSIYLALMRGSYNNAEIYYRNNSTGEMDTLKGFQAVVSQDSLITFNDVPSSLLAKCISDDSLKQAVENASPKDVVVGFILNQIQSNNLYFYVYPISIEYDNLYWEGKSHDVQIILNTYYQGVYYLGAFNTSTYALDYVLLMNSITVDGNTIEYFYDNNSDNVELDKAALNFHASKY